jgi:hypothetical protein
VYLGPVMLVLALAALALTGAVDDPVDGAGTPAQDIVHASSSFDSDAGSWSLTLRVREPVTSADVARVHGILYREDPARPGICPSDDTTGELGRLEADTDAPQSVSPDGRELTFTLTSPAFAGAQAVCATASLSKGHPLDVLDRPIILQAGYTPPVEETPAPAPRIALASRTARVSGRSATVRLKPFAARTTVSVGGHAAHGQRTVEAGRAVKLRVKLTRAARRKLAHHRRARVKLHVTALQTGAPRAARTLKVTLKRS